MVFSEQWRFYSDALIMLFMDVHPQDMRCYKLLSFCFT